MGWFSKLTTKTVRDPRSNDRRRQKRFAAQSLKCPLGDLVDLSTTGMRIACAEKLPVQRDAVFDFTIRNDFQQIPVKGRVVRMERVGRGRFEAGIAFVNVEPSVARAIEAIAQFGFVAREGPRTAGNARTEKTAAGSGAGNGSGGASGSGTSGGSGGRVSATVPDLYALLNVARDASDDVIHRAYRDMARKYHPDASKNGDTAKFFQRIHDAYKTLRDPQSRKTYDAMTRT